MEGLTIVNGGLGLRTVSGLFDARILASLRALKTPLLQNAHDVV